MVVLLRQNCINPSQTQRTADDYKCIEEIYEKISGAYNSMISNTGIKPVFRKNRQHVMIKHAVRFLLQHTNYGDEDIQNFAAGFVRKSEVLKMD